MKEDYFYQAKKQYSGPILEDPLAFHVHVYLRSGKASDLDNVLKATLDSLTGVVWQDDRQIDELHVYKHQDKQAPRIEISISSLAFLPK